MTLSDPEDIPASVPAPERIGLYRIERRLGRGGMGEVFLAWDDRLERRVAVKRIRHDRGMPPELRERFRREARAAARLSHPAIAQVHDLVEDSAGDSIVMEYVEGLTLAERLAVGPLPAAEAVRIGRQMAEGLAAAHEAGLIHRDLKAENVIVTPSGQAKILDFGLSRPVALDAGEEALTQHGALVGTLHAMSPEQAEGGDVDPRSDFFSLGALLYEMLTGKAPFRGANPLATLKQVLTVSPPPLSRELPELPAGLSDLVDRLLAKDRALRPRSALDVVLSLSWIESRTAEPSATGSVSDLPTGAMPVVRSAPVRPVPRTSGRSEPPADRVPPRRRWLSPAAAMFSALTVAALVLVAGGTFYAVRLGPVHTLRVAVAPPEVKAAAGAPPLDLAASGIVAATLSSLASLEGLAAVDPSENPPAGRAPIEIARATAADEVMAAQVESEEGTLAQVSLRRIQASDGRVLWSSTFKVPVDPEGLHLLADAVTVHLRHAYADHAVRAGAPDLDVRDEDYAAFVQIEKRIEAGEVLLASDLERLETIVRGSPRFLEAQIEAAKVALTLYGSRREPSYLERTAALVRQAEELAPGDPRPLVPKLRLALATNRDKDAEAILTRMEKLLPGDPEVLVQRSHLAESQGHWTEALRDLRTAAERTPSWRNYYWLARLEGRRGDLGESREHFATVLRMTPGNQWALLELAQLEMEHGDLERAEGLFSDLTRAKPLRNNFNNLGGVRFLRGRYAEAADAFRQALAIDADAVPTLTNLAETEVELGHDAEAKALYSRALARIEADAPSLGLPPAAGMRKATCLARLGRGREAANVVQEALHRDPDNPDLLYGAAFVFGVVGDRVSALGMAEAALRHGKSPRWFTGSAFRSMLEDPELRGLLKVSRR